MGQTAIRLVREGFAIHKLVEVLMCDFHIVDTYVTVLGARHDVGDGENDKLAPGTSHIICGLPPGVVIRSLVFHACG